MQRGLMQQDPLTHTQACASIIYREFRSVDACDRERIHMFWMPRQRDFSEQLCLA